MSKKKKNKKTSMTNLVMSTSSHIAKEMAVVKKGKGGAFQDKRDKKKNAEKWKQEVKNYY